MNGFLELVCPILQTSVVKVTSAVFTAAKCRCKNVRNRYSLCTCLGSLGFRDLCVSVVRFLRLA